MEHNRYKYVTTWIDVTARSTVRKTGFMSNSMWPKSALWDSVDAPKR